MKLIHIVSKLFLFRILTNLVNSPTPPPTLLKPKASLSDQKQQKTLAKYVDKLWPDSSLLISNHTSSRKSNPTRQPSNLKIQGCKIDIQSQKEMTNINTMTLSKPIKDNHLYLFNTSSPFEIVKTQPITTTPVIITNNQPQTVTGSSSTLSSSTPSFHTNNNVQRVPQQTPCITNFNYRHELSIAQQNITTFKIGETHKTQHVNDNTNVNQTLCRQVILKLFF